MLTHEKQPHRNDFRHPFVEKLSDFGLPSMFGESRYGKKKYKRKRKRLPVRGDTFHAYPENNSENISKDCQYDTEHQYNEESVQEHQESREDQGYDRNSRGDQYYNRDSREDHYYDRDLIEDQYYDRGSRGDQYCNRDSKEDQYYDRDSIEDQYYDRDSREDQCYDRESSEEKENNQNTPSDDDYSDYVPVMESQESPYNNDIEMPQENGEKNGKKSTLPEKAVTFDDQ